MLTIATAIGRSGYSPQLICPEGGELAAAARERHIPVEGWDFNRMRASYNPARIAGYALAWRQGSARLRQYAASSSTTLIHANHPVAALYSAAAARSLGLPLILHMHEGLVQKPLHRMALRWAARHSDRIICVSATARERVDEVGVDAARISVVPNGIDQVILGAPYAPTPEVTGPGPHIGIFGVIEPQKGHDVFLTAAVQVAQRYPTARFWIVGPDTYTDKAPYRRRIRELASAPPLAGRTTFTGYRSDVSRWMQAMDIVTMPSVGIESFGLVAAEAMALGRLVVASGAGGLADFIRDGDTGRLVPPGDADALATVINQMLENRPAGMGERASADIRARFSPDAFVEK
jgi:glycosyltransferase involved in cell wall biosynthesis